MMKSRSKEEIVQEMSIIMPFHLIPSAKPYIYEAMDIYANEHAQSLAKEVVDELSKQESMISRTKIVAIIKTKFQI